MRFSFDNMSNYGKGITMEPIRDINDPMEVLHRIEGYASNAQKSLANGNVQGAKMTVGFIKSFVKRFDELTK